MQVSFQTRRETAPVGRREAISFLTVALGLLSTVSRVSATEGRVRPKLFGGKVLEVRQDQHWFVMNGGASRKYSRVRINYDAQTKWTGVSLGGRPLRLGEPVQVTATPQGDAFRASVVLVLDPNATPAGGGPAKTTPQR